MEEFKFNPTDEKPSFYENTIIYHLLQTEDEFIEVKIHMKTPEKYNNARAHVNILMEKLANLLR